MMNRTTLATFLTTLALALPTTMIVAPSNAEAIGGVIKSSRTSGKRVHKRAGKKRTNKAKKTRKAKQNTRSRVKRTNRSSRTSSTSNRRVVHRSSSRTTSRRTNRRVVRRTTHRPSRRTVHRSSRRTTHHHRHRTRSNTTTRSTTNSSSGKSNIDVYLTGGLGTSGFSSSTISDQALPGLGYNLALGVKGKWLGAEIGFDGGGYTFDPDAGGTDLAYTGLFVDLKLQPTLDIFEPFAFVGVGGYLLADDIVKENTEGGALRAGVGANLRFDDFAIGAKYTFMSFSFADDSGIYGGDFGGASETVGVNLSIYF